MNRRRHQPLIFSPESEPVSRRGNGFLTWGAAVFLLFLFYVWGKVQVDFDLRDVEKLRQTRETLQRQIEAVRVEVHAMKSYERIVPKAKALGLVFVPVDRQARLQVDLRGLPKKPSPFGTALRYAGMGWFPRSRSAADRQDDTRQ